MSVSIGAIHGPTVIGDHNVTVQHDDRVTVVDADDAAVAALAEWARSVLGTVRGLDDAPSGLDADESEQLEQALTDLAGADATTQPASRLAKLRALAIRLLEAAGAEILVAAAARAPHLWP